VCLIISIELVEVPNAMIKINTLKKSVKRIWLL